MVGTHGLRDALGLGDSVGLGDALALAVGVDATVGAAAGESVGRAVGGVTAVDPQAARPTAMIIVLMMVMRFMPASSQETVTRVDGYIYANASNAPFSS